MELEELKVLWKEEVEKEVSTHKVNVDDVRGAITRKSQSTIADLKRTLLTKVVLTGITGSICIGIGFYSLFGSSEEALLLSDLMTPLQLGIMYTVLGVSLSIISVVNFFNRIRISDFEQSSLPIKETIQHVTKIIKGAMNLGTYSDLIVSPFIFAFVGYIIAFEKQFFDVEYPSLIVAGVYVAGIIFSYFSNRWGMKRRFGDDLNRLKRYLKELEL